MPGRCAITAGQARARLIAADVPGRDGHGRFRPGQPESGSWWRSPPGPYAMGATSTQGIPAMLHADAVIIDPRLRQGQKTARRDGVRLLRGLRRPAERRRLGGLSRLRAGG